MHQACEIGTYVTTYDQYDDEILKSYLNDASMSAKHRGQSSSSK